MMSRLLKVFPFLLILVLIGCGYVPTTPDDVETLKKGVVRINNGTGFIIHSTGNVLFVVSAKHVVTGKKDDELKELKITFYVTQSLSPTVLPIDGNIVVENKGDITLLRVSVEKNIVDNIYTFPLLKDPIVPSTTEQVKVIGFPSGSAAWTVISQSITNVNKLEIEVSKSGSDASGFSGGPIIKDGQVVGMVTDDTSTVLKGVTAMEIQNLAEKNKVFLIPGGSGVSSNRPPQDGQKPDRKPETPTTPVTSTPPTTSVTPTPLSDNVTQTKVVINPPDERLPLHPPEGQCSNEIDFILNRNTVDDPKIDERQKCEAIFDEEPKLRSFLKEEKNRIAFDKKIEAVRKRVEQYESFRKQVCRNFH